MTDLTSEAKVGLPLLPLNPHPNACCCDIPTCMLQVCNAIDLISCIFIPWLRLWHGGHVERWSPSRIFDWHAHFFLKRVRSICRNQMLVSQFERFLYSWSVVCWTIAHVVSYNGVIYCLKRASVHRSTVN